MATPAAKKVNAADLAVHLRRFCETYKPPNSTGDAKVLFGDGASSAAVVVDLGPRGYRFLNNLVFGVMLDEFSDKAGLDTKTLMEYNRQTLADYLVTHASGAYKKEGALTVIDSLIADLRREVLKAKKGDVALESVSDRGYFSDQKRYLDAADPTATVVADSAHYDQAIEALSGRAV